MRGFGLFAVAALAAACGATGPAQSGRDAAYHLAVDGLIDAGYEIERADPMARAIRARDRTAPWRVAFVRFEGERAGLVLVERGVVADGPRYEALRRRIGAEP